MIKLAKSTILVFLPFIVLSLNAQEIEDFKKCSLIDNPMERLACFDALVTDENKGSEVETKPEVEKPLPIKKEDITEEEVSKSSEKIIEEQKEKILTLERRVKRISRQRDVEKQENETKSQPFSATIESVKFINYKFKFKLDNGETWQLTDSGKRARLKKGETIRIVPGDMRSFFLENSKGRFRVKKIK